MLERDEFLESPIEVELTPEIEVSNPIQYRVLEPHKLWEILREGTDRFFGASDNFIDLGPRPVNISAKEPKVSFVNGELALKFAISVPTKELEQLLKKTDLLADVCTPLGKDLALEGNYITLDSKVLGYLVTNYDGMDLLFSPCRYNADQRFLITSQEEFITQLDLALQLVTVISNFVRLNQSVPDFRSDIILIRPPVTALAAKSNPAKEAEAVNNSLADSLMITPEKISVSFDDIGGQEEPLVATKNLADMLRYPQLFSYWGAQPPRGVLYYGPPGTGKTLLAKALAKEADALFFHVKSPDIAGQGLYGQSEQAIESLFREIIRLTRQAGRHGLIYIDEIDLLLPSKDDGSNKVHEATSSRIGSFARWMDGLEQVEGITIIGSTNNPLGIDARILSRMAQRIAVELPNQGGLVQIFSILNRRFSHKAGRALIDESTVDLQAVARRMSELNMSGRDVEDVLTVLFSKRGKLQLTRINEFLSQSQGQEHNDQDVRRILEEIQAGTVEASVVLEPITTAEILSTLETAKNIQSASNRLPIGFLRKP